MRMMKTYCMKTVRTIFGPVCGWKRKRNYSNNKPYSENGIEFFGWERLDIVAEIKKNKKGLKPLILMVVFWMCGIWIRIHNVIIATIIAATIIAANVNFIYHNFEVLAPVFIH